MNPNKGETAVCGSFHHLLKDWVGDHWLPQIRLRSPWPWFLLTWSGRCRNPVITIISHSSRNTDILLSSLITHIMQNVLERNSLQCTASQNFLTLLQIISHSCLIPFGILALSVFNACNNVFYQFLKISLFEAVSWCILNHVAFEIDFIRRNDNNG